MHYQVITPPPALKNHIHCIWTLESQTDDVPEKAFTVLCHGIPGLIFQQQPDAFSGFSGERLPQLFVFGQAKKYGQLHGGGRFRTIGVNFQPTGLKSLFGINAHELTNQHTCINNLVHTSLQEQLLHCRSAREQVACLFTFLQAQALRHDNDNRKLHYAVAALQAGKGLSHVTHQLNMSERSLERLFLTHVGITPVFYARICRFQSALELLRQGSFRSLTDIAYSLGYFDQSHFIHDFKLFSGVSPRIYLRKAIERMPGFPEWSS